LNYIDSLDSTISFRESTDNSGLNRPGYCDISILEDNEMTFYKISFYKDKEFWEAHPKDCRFAIIEINGKVDSEFSWSSTEKEEGIVLFNKRIIPELNRFCGKVVIEE
jgi:hypothetical protein